MPFQKLTSANLLLQPPRTFYTMLEDDHLVDKSKMLSTPHKKPLTLDGMLHEDDESELNLAVSMSLVFHKEQQRELGEMIEPNLASTVVGRQEPKEATWSVRTVDTTSTLHHSISVEGKMN